MLESERSFEIIEIDALQGSGSYFQNLLIYWPKTGDTKSETDSALLSIDREKYVAYCEGNEIMLPKKEFELLALLFSKPGKVFTREVILARVWGDDIVVGDRTIDVHIRKLREKLGDQYIKTVKGVGYKLKI